MYFSRFLLTLHLQIQILKILFSSMVFLSFFLPFSFEISFLFLISFSSLLFPSYMCIKGNKPGMSDGLAISNESVLYFGNNNDCSVQSWNISQVSYSSYFYCDPYFCSILENYLHPHDCLIFIFPFSLLLPLPPSLRKPSQQPMWTLSNQQIKKNVCGWTLLLLMTMVIYWRQQTDCLFLCVFPPPPPPPPPPPSFPSLFPSFILTLSSPLFLDQFCHGLHWLFRCKL